jgi:hypothetical protein
MDSGFLLLESCSREHKGGVTHSELFLMLARRKKQVRVHFLLDQQTPSPADAGLVRCGSKQADHSIA